jgi:hypothetical protein
VVVRDGRESSYLKLMHSFPMVPARVPGCTKFLITTALVFHSVRALDVSAAVHPNGSYDVLMDGVRWLSSPADVAPMMDGNKLKLIRQFSTTGTEAGLGVYHGDAIEWGGDAPVLVTEILDFGGSVPVLVFRQRWPQGIQNTTSICGNQPVSKSQNIAIHGFPMLSVGGQTASMPLNALSFGGNQISTTAVIPWTVHHKQRAGQCGAPGHCCPPNATHTISISRSRRDGIVPTLQPFSESPNGVCASAVMENNTDFGGNDLICYSHITSLSACCERCAANHNCTAISYGLWEPTGVMTCFLKTKAQHKAHRQGHQSLVIPGRELPTPPPSPPAPTPFLDAGSGLPLVLFNKSLHALVLSPINNFFTAVHTTRANVMRAGIKCSVRSLPANFSHDTILYAGRGLQGTMVDWGSILLERGGKHRVDPYEDLVLSNVGVRLWSTSPCNLASANMYSAFTSVLDGPRSSLLRLSSRLQQFPSCSQGGASRREAEGGPAKVLPVGTLLLVFIFRENNKYHHPLLLARTTGGTRRREGMQVVLLTGSRAWTCSHQD